jgi:oligosaccharide reducing-end xylanase
MRVQNPNHPSYRTFAWVVDPQGGQCDENSAPDGEEYFALALYFAHNRWGSAAGPSYDNYKLWADDLLDAMKNRQPVKGNRARKLDAGSDDGLPCTGTLTPEPVTSVSLFDAEHKIVRFNPTLGENFSDPSYHLPAFYALFAELGPPSDAAFWKEAAAVSRDFLGRAMNPATGLAPEYANYDGTPHAVSWNPNSARFAYDSWRVGGNVGMDWAWWSPSGTLERARADALVSFFARQGASKYDALWSLDGTNGSGGHSPGLVAMNAVATLATSPAVEPAARAILEDFWNTPLPTGKYRYYDGLLYVFGLLHLSGQYNIYDHPTTHP